MKAPILRMRRGFTRSLSNRSGVSSNQVGILLPCSPAHRFRWSEFSLAPHSGSGSEKRKETKEDVRSTCCLKASKYVSAELYDCELDIHDCHGWMKLQDLGIRTKIPAWFDGFPMPIRPLAPRLFLWASERDFPTADTFSDQDTSDPQCRSCWIPSRREIDINCFFALCVYGAHDTCRRIVPASRTSNTNRRARLVSFTTSFTTQIIQVEIGFPTLEPWPSPGLRSQFPHGLQGVSVPTSEGRSKKPAALAIGSPPTLRQLEASDRFCSGFGGFLSHRGSPSHHPF